jgi:hypothetical protein
MPTIPVNLGAIEAFESIPVGSYFGAISKMQYREAKEAGKFASLMVTYTVISEEEGQLGRKMSEFLSFSPKALFRMKRWFAKFGLGDLPAFEVDDATGEILEPDLIDVQVIFKVTLDGDRSRTELVSVEDDMSQPAAPPPPPAPVARARTMPAAQALPPVQRVAPAHAAVPAEPDPEDLEAPEEDEAPAPVARPRRPAPSVTPAAVAAPRPAVARRTLR